VTVTGRRDRWTGASQRLSMLLPLDLFDRVNVEARSAGLSVAAWVRRAIAAHIPPATDGESDDGDHAGGGVRDGHGAPDGRSRPVG